MGIAAAVAPTTTTTATTEWSKPAALFRPGSKGAAITNQKSPTTQQYDVGGTVLQTKQELLRVQDLPLLLPKSGA